MPRPTASPRMEDEMTERAKYVKRGGNPVVAVQLDLETEGFDYEKWGSTQRCKPGDWLVNNGGEVYTIDGETFVRTYQALGLAGQFVKTAPVWAEIANEPGSVETKEGTTHYGAGDYIVSNEEDGGDSYAVSAGKFEEMYEPA